MSEQTLIVFNLLFNAICSFLAGFLIVAFFVKLFRVGATRWKLFLLGLPFVKIIWDICRGIPPQSFIFTGLNPWLLPEKHKSLVIGAGFSYYGPIVNVAFTARMPEGTEYPISVADFVATWLGTRIHPSLPSAILLVVSLVSMALLIRRAIVFFWFDGKRQRHFRLRGEIFQKLLVPGFIKRQAVLYLSPDYEGTPFTGGILRPYICLPKTSFEMLTPSERNAVIQHEMAHIQSWDILYTAITKILGDIFWFVPFYRYLSNRIDRLREILADRDAVKLGAAPEHLASALVRLKETIIGAPHLVLYSAFVRERSLLRTRVELLLNAGALTLGERWGWNRKFGKIVIASWVSGAVMAATLGGNHEVIVEPIPQWVKALYNAMRN